MTLSDLVIRDPFVLPDKDGYYIYGTTFDASHPNSFRVYHSKDLCDIDSSDVVFQASEDFWAKKDFWAPEVYHRLGRYYMAASFGYDVSMKVQFLGDVSLGMEIRLNNNKSLWIAGCLNTCTIKDDTGSAVAELLEGANFLGKIGFSF